MISESVSLVITVALVCALAACVGVLAIEMYNTGQKAVLLSNVHVHAWNLDGSIYVENDGPFPVLVKYVITNGKITRVNLLLRSHKSYTLSENGSSLWVCLPDTSLCELVPVEKPILLYSAPAVKKQTQNKPRGTTPGPVPLHPAIAHHYTPPKRYVYHSPGSSGNPYKLLEEELEKQNSKKNQETSKKNENVRKPLSMNEAITIVERTKLYGRYVWVPKVPVNSISNCGHEVVCLDIGSYNPSSYNW